MADERRPRGYMPDAVSLPGIGAGALMIVGAIAIGLTAAFVVLHVDTDGHPTPENAMHYGHPPPIAGDVKLETLPANDIAAFRAQKQRLLSTYGWVDRAHGIARIPIERAIELATHGASARTASP
ncbi:MAG TPA: hypothetical protein VL654_11630 [Casimicrobiaceae bacterium]|nr:hypothetical protein [Casimicrobiaceae bacterium]